MEVDFLMAPRNVLLKEGMDLLRACPDAIAGLLNIDLSGCETPDDKALRICLACLVDGRVDLTNVATIFTEHARNGHYDAWSEEHYAVVLAYIELASGYWHNMRYADRRDVFKRILMETDIDELSAAWTAMQDVSAQYDAAAGNA